METNDFVGWRRSDDVTESRDYERIVFRFDGTYNFSGVAVFLANQIGSDVSRPRTIEVRLSRKFPRASLVDPATTLTTIHQLSSADSNLQKTEWIYINLADQSRNVNLSTRSYDNVAVYVELRIYYAGIWIALGEVTFKNGDFLSLFFEESSNKLYLIT